MEDLGSLQFEREKVEWTPNLPGEEIFLTGP